MKWNSVDFCTPDVDGEYLCAYLPNDGNNYCYKILSFANDLVDVDEHDFYRHEQGFYDYNSGTGYYEREDVLYWMPIPTIDFATDIDVGDKEE